MLPAHAQIVVTNTDVVVGDVLFLDTGDKVIADGLVISSQGLVIDEASLTGESDPIKKDADHDPWVRSGTAVNEGSGYVLITAVGTSSEWGKTMALVNEAGDEETPLQEQLTYVATQISKLGVLAAVICFLALFIKWLVVNKGFPVSKVKSARLPRMGGGRGGRCRAVVAVPDRQGTSNCCGCCCLWGADQRERPAAVPAVRHHHHRRVHPRGPAAGRDAHAGLLHEEDDERQQ